MPQNAQVTSLEALEAFRSHLIVYISQARPALEEVTAEVVRARGWLEDGQRVYWEGQLRRRSKQLEEAQQALFSARLGTLRHETAQDQLLVHRAKQAIEEANAKLRILKRWIRDFDGRVQPLVKQTEKLHTVLSQDLVKAITYLTQTINTLAAYAEIRSASASNSQAPESKPAAPAAAEASTAEGAK